LQICIILLFYGCKDKSALRNLCSQKETKSRAIFTDRTARCKQLRKMKLAENNGIVGTIISDIATIKVNLFSLQGEDLTFEDISCVLILGLGKDIQITDYRLQIIWGAMYASNKKI